MQDDVIFMMSKEIELSSPTFSWKMNNTLLGFVHYSILLFSSKDPVWMGDSMSMCLLFNLLT